MSNIAFVFPGQGSQCVGMGKDFYQKYYESRQIYEMASEISGIDVKKLCFEKNELIYNTKYMQLAIFTTTIAILEVLSQQIAPVMSAGLSLGEYSALALSGAVQKESLFSVVQKRGQLMSEAYQQKCIMAAISTKKVDVIENVCNEIVGNVYVANYNSPMQTVITGEESAVMKAIERLKTFGIQNVFILNVSGPFHCILLNEAAKKLADALVDIPFGDIKIPYISNVTADFAIANQINGLLERQIVSPVMWKQSVEKMILEGIDTFVEIGPGNTLSNLIRSINRNVTCISIGKVSQLNSLLLEKECCLWN